MHLISEFFRYSSSMSRPALWKWPVGEKFWNKIFKLKHLSSLGRHGKVEPHFLYTGDYLIPLIAMKFWHLHGCFTEERPASSSDAYPFITPRFVHVDEVVWAEFWDEMTVVIMLQRWLGCEIRSKTFPFLLVESKRWWLMIEIAVRIFNCKRGLLVYVKTRVEWLERWPLLAATVLWQVSFDCLRHKKISVTELLSFMSLFDRQGIPENLIRHQPKANLTTSPSQDSSITLVTGS